MDIAASIQKVTEDIILKITKLKERTEYENLCLGWWCCFKLCSKRENTRKFWI